MSSVPPARTDEMFGEASSDLPGFGEAGTLRLVNVSGGYVEPFGADIGPLAGDDVDSGSFLTVQTGGVLCSIGSGEVDLGMMK